MALASALFYSTKSPLVRIGIEAGATVPALAALRMAFCAAIFFIISRFRKTGSGGSGLWRSPALIAAALLFTGSVISSFYAVAYAGVSLTVILVYSHPVFVALFSRVFLGTRLGPLKNFLLLTAYAGCASIALTQPGGSGGKDVLLGSILALVAAATYAGYQLLVQRFSKKASAFEIASATSYWSVAPSLLMWRFSPPTVPLKALAVTAGLGFFSTFLPLALLAGAISRIGAARTSTISLAGPFFGLLLARLLFGETLTPVQLLAGGVVLVSVSALYLVPGNR
jgi:drug/metabolite transporter (DMT)-like permease